jgi:predicted AlkP superfamily phosphohydrolase/phosphomutase/tetratricopeptide (TPR) repeat protein
MTAWGSDRDKPFQAHAGRVLLVGWEAADWYLIKPLLESGELPHLAGIIDRGVMGSILSPVPVVCPVVWTSVATGVLGDKHGVLSLVEPDGKGDVRPVQSTSRHKKAIWNVLSQHGLRSLVVGWPATHPAEQVNGIVVSDRFPQTYGPAAELWPADQHTVHPDELFTPLMDLRLHPRELSFHQLSEFVPGLKDIDGGKDPRIVAIANLLAQAATIQNAATWIAEREPWDFMAVYYYMLGGLCHGFIKYHPPSDESVDKKEADLFGSVIGTCYKFYDSMLGRLLELAGPETMVVLVSDHGFYKSPIPLGLRPCEGRRRADPSQVRPVSLRHHRRDGVFCAAGPNVREDELVFGAQLIDVAPTILASMGLAVPADVDGEVIAGMFKVDPCPEQIDSYEAHCDGDGVHHPELVEDPWAAHSVLESLSTFGFLGLQSEAATALEVCRRQRLVHLADILSSRGRFAEALDVSQELSKLDDSFMTRIPAIQCLLNLGRLEEAEEGIRSMDAMVTDAPTTLLLWTKLHLRRGDLPAARDCLERAGGVDPLTADFPMQLGWLALRLDLLDWAVEHFRRALERDPDFAQAHDGLGVALLRLGQVEESVEHHLHSVRLLYNRSAAHEHLGESLTAAGEIDWAIRTLRIAVNLDPKNPRARALLSRAERVKEAAARAAAEDTSGAEGG